MASGNKIKLPDGLKGQIQEHNKLRQKGHVGKVKAAGHAAVARNDPAPKLRSERWPLHKLKEADRRARKTSPEQLERVMRSVSQLGFLKPVLITAEGEIIDGHILVDAARRMGLPDIECSIVDHLSKDEIRIARVALNRIAETGEWDLGTLSLELEELEIVGLDLEISGWDAGELDLILGDGRVTGKIKPAKSPPVKAASLPDDLWLLGDHRLLCASCLEPSSYERLLAGNKIDCVFSDPPYNTKIDGVVSGLGKTKHDEFAMACGEMTDDQFRAFLAQYLELCKTHAAEGAVIYACMDWRQADLLMFAGRDVELHRINKAIWNKGSGSMGSLYRSAYEEVVVFCTAKTPTTNNVLLGKNGRNRTNVWTYAGANRPGSSAGKAVKHHPTPKPIELVADALLDVTNRGDIVLDPFMGSGATLLAAENIERIAFGIELAPKYVDLTIQRWEEMTGKQAVHATLTKTFAELKAERLSPP